jgi:hypothetical protein
MLTVLARHGFAVDRRAHDELLAFGRGQLPEDR